MESKGSEMTLKFFTVGELKKYLETIGDNVQLIGTEEVWDLLYDKEYIEVNYYKEENQLSIW